VQEYIDFLLDEEGKLLVQFINLLVFLLEEAPLLAAALLRDVQDILELQEVTRRRW